jgi:hypothetical protein
MRRPLFPLAVRQNYPVDEGCYRLGIGRTSIYAMAARGEIKLIKIAGRTLVPQSEIDRLSDATTTPSEHSAALSRPKNG